MTTGYAELDDYGRQVTPSLIDSVTNPDGSILYQASGQNCTNCVNGRPTPPLSTFSAAQLAHPDSVFQMITMMRGVVLRGTGQPVVMGITQPIAGKTGTTNDFNDAWSWASAPASSPVAGLATIRLPAWATIRPAPKSAARSGTPT